MTRHEFERLKDFIKNNPELAKRAIGPKRLIDEIERLRESLQFYADSGGHEAKKALGYYDNVIEEDRV